MAGVTVTVCVLRGVYVEREGGRRVLLAGRKEEGRETCSEAE